MRELQQKIERLETEDGKWRYIYVTNESQRLTHQLNRHTGVITSSTIALDRTLPLRQLSKNQVPAPTLLTFLMLWERAEEYLKED